MKAKEYVEKAIMTESNNFTNKSFLGRLTFKLFLSNHPGTLAERFSLPRNIRLLHATIGSMTEIGELFEMIEKPILDLTNLREEVGDITWYIAIACDAMGFDLQEMVDKSDSHKKQSLSTEQVKRTQIELVLSKATISASKILDLMKKSVFYGRKLDESALKDQLTELIKQCVMLLQVGDFHIEESFDINIKKLHAKRFKGGKFTEKEAVNRNLDEERKTLEGKD